MKIEKWRSLMGLYRDFMNSKSLCELFCLKLLIFWEISNKQTTFPERCGYIKLGSKVIRGHFPWILVIQNNLYFLKHKDSFGKEKFKK